MKMVEMFAVFTRRGDGEWTPYKSEVFDEGEPHFAVLLFDDRYDAENFSSAQCEGFEEPPRQYMIKNVSFEVKE